MRNVRMTIWVMVVVRAMLFGGLVPTHGVVTFDNGDSHYVDYDIFESVYVRGNTVIEFGPGSYVKFSTFTFDNSRVIISGGRLEDDVWAADNSTVTITAGEFCWGTLNGGAIPRLRGMSSATIIGSDFELDGVPVSGLMDIPFSNPPQYLTGHSSMANPSLLLLTAISYSSPNHHALTSRHGRFDGEEKTLKYSP